MFPCNVVECIHKTKPHFPLRLQGELRMLRASPGECSRKLNVGMEVLDRQAAESALFWII